MQHRLKVKKSSIIHYLLLYLLLLLNGSRIWIVTARRNSTIATAIQLFIIVLAFCFMLSKPKKFNFKYSLAELGLLALFIVFVRFKSGGVGIFSLIEWAAYLLLAHIIVLYDTKNVMQRFVNIVYVFAAISIIGYILQIAFPSVLQSILPSYESNFSAYAGMSGQTILYRAQTAWGRFIFTFDERQITRNVGLFSEPGVYQIVLNSALFILLFMRGTTSFNAKQYRRRLIVLIAALLTSQSVTGYIGFIVLLLFYVASKQNEQGASGTRRFITVLGFVILLFVAIDYSIRGTSSLTYNVFLGRLFNSQGRIDLSVSSGMYRMGTIGTSLQLIVSHPLGMGYDAANNAIQLAFSGSSGAIILITGAALGIIPLLSIIIWTVYPIIHSRLINKAAKIALVFIWINTALAQSEEFYTGYIIIVLYLLATLKEKKIAGE